MHRKGDEGRCCHLTSRLLCILICKDCTATRGCDCDLRFYLGSLPYALRFGLEVGLLAAIRVVETSRMMEDDIEVNSILDQEGSYFFCGYGLEPKS